MDLKNAFYLLILLNPFALFLYMKGIMASLRHRVFLWVLFRASLISFFIYYFFALVGEWVFSNVFRIDFESFKVFGGLVLFYHAFVFIIKGGESMITLKGSLDELAAEIALPFIVGAGSISVCILIGNENNAAVTALQIAGALVVNYVVIIALKAAREFTKRKIDKDVFDKYMAILVRVIGFMVGAVGVDLVLHSIRAIMLRG
jgi:multiple antibiotic resistance protein